MSPPGTIATPPAVRLAGSPAGDTRSLAGIAAPASVAVPRQQRACSRGEILACAVGLSLLALLMCAGHIRHGGFYYDDWGVLAIARFPPAGGALHGLWLYYGQRPAQVLYYAALDHVLGMDAAARLALAAAMVVLQATVLYALLRRLGMRARDALACAALSLTFPFSDSVWLWGILSLASFAIAASLLGVILALRAFERAGPRSLALHASSLALYVVGILSYEVFAVAGCLAGLLYVRAVGFARARTRWAVDVAVLSATTLLCRILLPIDIATPSRTQSVAGLLGHAAQMAAAGTRVAGAAFLPIRGVSPWIGAGLLVAGLAAAAELRRRLANGASTRVVLGRWLALAAAGSALAAVAWAVYLPAPDHYSPSAAGTVNRVNALAAIGVALLLYSVLVLLGRVLVALLHLSAAAAAALAAVLAVALCVAYLHRTAADARAWDAAASEQRQVLSDVRAALPRPVPEAVIYAFDAPQVVGPGVPVLNTTLDLTSATRISYANPTLTAVQVVRAADVRCGARGPSAGGVQGAYGRSYLLDVRARHAARMDLRARCAYAIAG